MKEKCIDPCLSPFCGLNATCSVKEHNPICSCPSGKTGDPLRSCIEIANDCKKNEECSEKLFCLDGKCIDPCATACGLKAECTIRDGDNRAICSCPKGYTGNPFIQCALLEKESSPDVRSDVKCLNNIDCDTNFACINDKCVDVCPGACGVNSKCTPKDHVAICNCPPGTTGDSFVICKEIGNECKSDDECSEKKNTICVDGRCMEPCAKACGLKAECTVRDKRAICTCPTDLTGNPFIECVSIPGRIISGKKCVTNSDCDRSLTCINDTCLAVCPSNCGINANCTLINHDPICHCPPGTTGDPFKICKEIGTECKKDDECSEKNMLCIKGNCIDACLRACGMRAECGINVDNRNPYCSCPSGYTGNPFEVCYPITEKNTTDLKCVDNIDCVSSLKCVNEKCIDVCPSDCGINAKCTMIDHAPVCNCPPDTTGNPFINCHKIDRKCTKNEECSEKEYEFCVDEKCQSCKEICAPQAECSSKEGKPICSCPVGTVGDPFKSCISLALLG